MSDGSSPKWWAWAPRVVAEALRTLEPAGAVLLRPGPEAPPAEVARAIAAALAPPRAEHAAPEWLDVDQADAFRLLMHALQTDGAALCADPVGTGKTYLALAVARAIGGEPPPCLVPAPLVPQWEAVAHRLGVPIRVWSHSRASRGSLPGGGSRLVIIDESHHFRRATTRRYRTVAPWLAGRRLLLLSATPIVNSAWDLYHQLHLGLRDDTLAFHGAPSLRTAFRHTAVPPELGRFVIERLAPAGQPRRRDTAMVLASGAEPLLDELDGLMLSQNPGIASLVRSVLLQSAASSADALQSSLARYRSILLQARDASEVGQSATRRRLRRLVAGAAEQMELWTLLPDGADGDELVLEDLPLVARLHASARDCAGVPDEKARHLARLLDDGRTTLVFTATPDTLPFLRESLAPRRAAWCTGNAAGIGATRMPRHDVLGWFRPGAPDVPGRPGILLSTDVAAEGLDLHRADRVVHYDLPWTEVRLAQRDGRAARRGSGAECVDLIRYLPTPPFEDRLRQLRILSRKASLPGTFGIGPEGRARWRWRREFADEMSGPTCEGVGAVRSGHVGWLAGIALEAGGARVAATALWRPESAEWSEDSEVIRARIGEACHAESIRPPDTADLREVLYTLDPLVRRLHQEASRVRIGGATPGEAAGRLGGRLRLLARDAFRERDWPRLAAIEEALRFASRGHNAGEESLIQGLLAEQDAGLLALLHTLPRAASTQVTLRARLIGLIQFRT